MLKSATMVLATLTAGWLLFGSPTSASAHEECEACKPTFETHIKNERRPGKTITITHHKTVKEHVRVPHTIRTITRIRPINTVHEVTIVDHYKVPVPEYHHEHLVEWLTPEVHHTYQTINRYHGCGCGGY